MFTKMGIYIFKRFWVKGQTPKKTFALFNYLPTPEKCSGCMCVACVNTYFGLGEETNTVSLVFFRSMGITIL